MSFEEFHNNADVEAFQAVRLALVSREAPEYGRATYVIISNNFQRISNRITEAKIVFYGIGHLTRSEIQSTGSTLGESKRASSCPV